MYPRQPNILILLEWYDHAIRRGIARAARERGWHLTVPAGSLLPVGWKGDGVLTILGRDRRLAAYIRGMRCPVVDLGCYRPDIPLPRVLGDHRLIGQLGAEHFISRLFRHLAFFALGPSPVEELRFEGFAGACRAASLPKPAEWVLPRSNDWPAANRWLRQRLTRAAKPLGVFAYNDEAASWVEDSCRAAGLAVPGEVAILGVDDNDLICLNQPVPLSSIAHDREQIGYRGAALLADLLAGKPAPAAPILIPPAGVISRQSSDATAVEQPRVRRALACLGESLGKSFGATDLAAAAGVSRATLDRLFLRYIGRSVHEEIDRRRIERAKDLLLRTNLPLAAVAKRVSLCNAQYLVRLFRASEGTTPRAYRQERRPV